MEFVAFIRPKGAAGPIRIVKTEHPQGLIQEAATHSPVEMNLIGSLDAHDWPVEWWHIQLAPWTVRADWYAPSPHVLCLIEDAFMRRIRAPGPDAHVPEKIPKFFRQLTNKEALRLKWAFPSVDPYPPIPTPAPVPKSRVQALAHRALRKARTAA